ncbi:unnamed protein product [Cochlearia groenlandica]
MALPSSCFSQPLSSSSLSVIITLLALYSFAYLSKSYVTNLSLSKTKSKMCIDSSKIRFNSPWSFIGGSRIDLFTNVSSNSSSVNRKKVSGVRASWIDTSHIANNAFAVGTMAVLPFYALMVLAPKAIIVSFFNCNLLVFKDGLENKIETRHSVLLCLLACPVGLVSHLVTKALTTGITLPKRPNN